MAEALGSEEEHGANFPSADKIEEVRKKLFYELDELDKKAEAYKEDTQVNRANMTAIKKTAKKDHGIPASVLNVMIAEEKARRSIVRRKSAMSDDDQDYLKAVKDSLGELADTPLGRAVLAEAKGEEE